MHSLIARRETHRHPHPQAALCNGKDSERREQRQGREIVLARAMPSRILSSCDKDSERREQRQEKRSLSSGHCSTAILSQRGKGNDALPVTAPSLDKVGRAADAMQAAHHPVPPSYDHLADSIRPQSPRHQTPLKKLRLKIYRR